MAVFTQAQRKTLAAKGQAEPDGSFPIRNGSDLDNAIRAYGRSSDKPATKAWIVKRAKELGMSSKIPLSWQGGK
jgi:hypothetical protein